MFNICLPMAWDVVNWRYILSRSTIKVSHSQTFFLPVKSKLVNGCSAHLYTLGPFFTIHRAQGKPGKFYVRPFCFQSQSHTCHLWLFASVTPEQEYQAWNSGLSAAGNKDSSTSVEFISFCWLNLFHATGLFRNPLKTTESLWYSDLFKRYGKRLVTSNDLKKAKGN